MLKISLQRLLSKLAIIAATASPALAAPETVEVVPDPALICDGTIDADLASPRGEVFRERLAVALTPKVLANLLAQYNDLSQVASVNFRFNWNYRPGSDLFVVYNQTWDGPGGVPLHRRDRQLMVKLTVLFQR